MEKILIVGKDTKYYENVMQSFNDKYEIQVCDFVNSTIRKTIRTIQPILVMVIKPISSSAMSIKEIKDVCPDTDLLIICEEKDVSMQNYGGIKPACLYKPFKMKELQEMVSQMVAEKSAAINRRSILAVDDNGMVLREIKELIGGEYDLTFATSGAKALDYLDKKEFDLVLLDYEMPVMSGYEVFKEIKKKEKTKDIPVVFLTGVSDRNRIVEVVAHHPAGYLLKPIDTELLNSTLETVFQN